MKKNISIIYKEQTYNETKILIHNLLLIVWKNFLQAEVANDIICWIFTCAMQIMTVRIYGANIIFQKNFFIWTIKILCKFREPLIAALGAHVIVSVEFALAL